MPKPISGNRLLVVRAWQAARARGVQVPTMADLQGLSPAALAIAETTVRILRVIEASKAKGASAIWAWQEKQILAHAQAAGSKDLESILEWMVGKEAAGERFPVPSALLVGFNSGTADQIIEALNTTDGEPVREGVDVDMGEPKQPERMDAHEGGMGKDGGHAHGTEPRSVVRPDMVVLWEQWQAAADRDRRAAAEQARADERKIADAQLEAERTQRAAAVTVARTHGRMLALVIGMLALIAGALGGILWSNHAGFTGRASEPSPSAPPSAGVSHVEPAMQASPPQQPSTGRAEGGEVKPPVMQEQTKDQHSEAPLPGETLSP